MTQPFQTLDDLPALDAAIERARHEPILIFKHSATCGISAQAYHELAEWYELNAVPVPVFLIHVRRHRAVSNAVAEGFGVRHESPQIMLLEGGAVRWHGSHWHVNGREVQLALDAIAATAG